MSMLVTIALALISRVKRQIAWFHMPVPKDRNDQGYFAPLKRLAPKLAAAETELYLGLVYVYSRVGPYLRIPLINSQICAAALTACVLTKHGDTEKQSYVLAEEENFKASLFGARTRSRRFLSETHADGSTLLY